MKNTRTTICLITIAVAILTTVPGMTQVPAARGRNSAHLMTPAFTIPGIGNRVVATLTLLQGRRGFVLEVDALLHVYHPDNGALYTLIRANGVNLFGGNAAQDCTGEVACSLVATGWLDLDDAETDNPGSFIGKPIVVELIAGNGFATVASAEATVRARLQSK